MYGILLNVHDFWVSRSTENNFKDLLLKDFFVAAPQV
jgi:hypothetical protein